MDEKEPEYPLEQVLEVKKKRVERAEKVVHEKKSALEVEEEKMKKCEAARDEVKDHYDDKLAQLRAVLDEGSTAPKIQQMKVYLKVVKEKLDVEEKKVSDQQQEVEKAQKNLEEAEEELRKRRQEVDKIETHREEWTKEMKAEMIKKEGIEQDEMGNIIFLGKKRK
ncbi:type III secretion T3S chaperone [Simkania negevensis]|uniref:Type III secretion T3S chaperone n=1 Tax=Simkania negevensis TaxID=83561 RepID=A0ABS3ARQ9_9BACT|nr:type III secretion T3S chaperone [Simkania negevensis]